MNADGGTDGDDLNLATAHGEDCRQAFSHSSGYSGRGGAGNENKGDAFFADGTLQGSGWVKFIRTTTQVEIWGEVAFPAPPNGPGTVQFHTGGATLVANDTAEAGLACAVTPTDAIDDADLNGVVIIS